MHLRRNLEKIQGNPYPGRGTICGFSADLALLFMVYWLMGRSPNSRARFLAHRGGRLWTEPTDPKLVTDPRLVIYNAMDEHNGIYVVSNGHQTDTAIEYASQRKDFSAAMGEWEYEPDKPNYTPRITMQLAFRPQTRPGLYMSILRRHSADSETCVRDQYEEVLTEAGVGYCMTTYSGDGDPLPAFKGEPYQVPLEGNADDVAAFYWDLLNPDNRIALAVKSIDMATGHSQIQVINKYAKVAA